jgi:RNA polymerase sigma factor (TIGR02999 family)
MGPALQSDVTELLHAWSEGDASALERLTPLVYQELHRVARLYMKQEQPGHTLQATALVNEAYLRLVNVNRMQWQNRAHFFAVSAQIMRRILVEFARRRHRDKRGGDALHVTFDKALAIASGTAEPDLSALDEALTRLAALDPRMSRVVELRFFGGFTAEETADVLEISPETVLRDWRTAKVWLLKAMMSDK